MSNIRERLVRSKVKPEAEDLCFSNLSRASSTGDHELNEDWLRCGCGRRASVGSLAELVTRARADQQRWSSVD